MMMSSHTVHVHKCSGRGGGRGGLTSAIHQTTVLSVRSEGEMYVFSKEKHYLQLRIVSKIQHTSKLNLNLPFKPSRERNKQKQLQDTE